MTTGHKRPAYTFRRTNGANRTISIVGAYIERHQNGTQRRKARVVSAKLAIVPVNLIPFILGPNITYNRLFETQDFLRFIIFN